MRKSDKGNRCRGQMFIYDLYPTFFKQYREKYRIGDRLRATFEGDRWNQSERGSDRKKNEENQTRGSDVGIRSYRGGRT